MRRSRRAIALTDAAPPIAVFTEEALLAHEQEVAALEAKLAEFAPLAAMLKEHRQMKHDYKDFLVRPRPPPRPYVAGPDSCVPPIAEVE